MRLTAKQSLILGIANWTGHYVPYGKRERKSLEILSSRFKFMEERAYATYRWWVVTPLGKAYLRSEADQ